MPHSDYVENFDRRRNYLLKVVRNTCKETDFGAEDIVSDAVVKLLALYGSDPVTHRPLGQTGATAVRRQAVDHHRRQELARRTEQRYERELGTDIRNGFHNTPSPEGAVVEKEVLEAWRALKAAVLAESPEKWRALDSDLLDLLFDEKQPTSREVVIPVAEKHGAYTNTARARVVKLRHQLKAVWARSQGKAPWRAL